MSNVIAGTEVRAARDESTSAARRVCVRWLLILIAALAAHQTFALWAQESNYDEYQMCADGYAITQGEMLYRDIWDNHGPLHTYMIAATLDRLKPGSHSILLFFRSWSLLCQLGTAALLYVWVRRMRLDDDGLLASLSVVLLFLSAVFTRRGIEIRADVPFMFVWMASLTIWFEAHRSGRSRDWFLSGLVLGACFWFSPKTLPLGVAAGLMFLLAMAIRRRISIMPMVWFGVGTAIAPALMLVTLRLEGNLHAFLDSFIGQNLDRVHVPITKGFKELRDEDPCTFLPMLAAFVWAIRRAFRRGLPEVMALTAIGGGFLLFQYLFLLPTRHSQSMLPAMPMTSALTAWAALDWIRSRREAGFSPPWMNLKAAGGIVLALALVHGARMKFFHFEFLRELRGLDSRGSAMEAGALLQDGCGVPLFFTRPTKYKSLVRVLRDGAKSGKIDLGFDAAMAERDVKYALLDMRSAELGGKFKTFLRENYIPMRRRRLLVAGKVITPTPEGVARFEIVVAGTYYWQAPGAGGEAPVVDGKPLDEGPVALADGPHEARWSGDQPIVFAQIPPEKWGRWLGVLEEDYPDQNNFDQKEPIFWPKSPKKSGA